jgi:hypothetical protein
LKKDKTRLDHRVEKGAGIELCPVAIRFHKLSLGSHFGNDPKHFLTPESCNQKVPNLAAGILHLKKPETCPQHT